MMDEKNNEKLAALKEQAAKPGQPQQAVTGSGKAKRTKKDRTHLTVAECPAITELVKRVGRMETATLLFVSPNTISSAVNGRPISRGTERLAEMIVEQMQAEEDAAAMAMSYEDGTASPPDEMWLVEVPKEKLPTLIEISPVLDNEILTRREDLAAFRVSGKSVEMTKKLIKNFEGTVVFAVRADNV
jgi:hypothetical protein